jgi:hypothetical protein
MNKKKLILSSVLSVLALAVIIVCYVLIAKPFTPKADGEIQIVLVNLDGTIVSDKKIEFNVGDTLEQLLKENYENVAITDGMIMSIEAFTTPSDWATFSSIYVDDEMSMVGLLDIQFEDGSKISFVNADILNVACTPLSKLIIVT